MTQTAERREFQAEVSQLLDIVVHSLYSNKDIFLRELISNASDALDKVRIAGLTQPDLLPAGDLEIDVERDTERRTLSVADNGIGMSRDELVENLGTIARSGTAQFLETVREARSSAVDAQLIGQFGVGFYSSFMVADRVTVITRRAGEESATKWESAGEGWFTIGDAERETAGTTVTLHLKSVDEDNGIKDYTQEWIVREIIKRYSDFVAYPIRMTVQEREGGDDESTESSRMVEKEITVNSMKAIWARPANEVEDEDYKQFYQHIAHDWNEPLTRLTTRMEGTLDARALLFIPSRAPFDLYHDEMSYRGLQLYVKRVFIMDECRDLMPRHLRFIKGIVDAEDLSLNVSRELLQQDRQIRAIRRFLVRKVMDTLSKLRKDEPEKYDTFWGQFGPVLKEGLLDWEEKHEPILDLVLAPSSRDPSALSSLADYVGRMKSDQDVIYYLVGPSLESARHSPHAEACIEQGYEVLYFTDAVDDVWLPRAPKYQDHEWRSVGQGDLKLGDEDDEKEKEAQRKEQADQHKDLIAALYEPLKERVKAVTLSERLRSSAACLVGAEHDLSPRIAEMLRRSGQPVPETLRTLEINPNHAVVEKLKTRFDKDPSDPLIAEYANLLFGQAVLAEGGRLPDPAEFSRQVAELMTRSL